jgi:photosystem II stability/assembly factor-like uncharacterized protein
MLRSARLLATLLAASMAAPAAMAAATPADEQDSPYGALAYRLVGPMVGGRISRVAGVPGDPLTWYAAAAQGGVWRSRNGGRDWEPVFDDEISQSIGAIAVAPSDPNTVWVGGGEANPRGNVAIGLGIWKSTDAGATWNHVLALRGQIGTIAVHPRDADTAFAAVLGSPFGPGPERGVYRTRDGGATWDAVLTVDADTGASDVAYDPNNPSILFAGTWQFRRSPWNATSGGPGSGLWRSADGGETWTRLTGAGLPEGEWGKVGVRVAPSDSRRVYALIEAAEGGLFRSDDGGSTWKRVNAHRSLRQRAWYYTVLTIDPRNADVVWFPQVPLLRTIDGGRSVQQVDGPHHGDHHDIWIDPADPRRMISGNDGGVDLSFDGGETWFVPPLPLAQFYNIDVDDRVPYHVGGTIQDWGTASGPVRGPANATSALADWHFVGGGEAGDFVYDRSRPGTIYAGEYGGYISRYVEGSGQSRAISAWPANPSGILPKDLRLRYQWTAPIARSPHDPDVLYHGANVLLKTRDGGATWTPISGDLTRDDESRQQWSGGPITGDITGVETYGTIFSVAESPVAAGTIWVGSDDGLVHLTRDGGATWANVTPRALPEWATIESIEPDPVDADSAWVVAHRYRLDDFRPYLYRTRNGGRSWESLGKDLPADLPLWALRIDPDDHAWIYLGTDRGVWHSRDGGRRFEELRLNLPAVTVTDLEARHGDLIVGTRGRSIWVLENLASLRALPAAREQSLAILPVASAVRWRDAARWDFLVQGAVDEIPAGAVVRYWLREAPKGELTLTVRDAEGRVLRTLSSVPKPARYGPDDPDEPAPEPEPELSTEVGLNQAMWDLRLAGARRIGSKIDYGYPEQGPPAPPGTYTLELGADGTSATTTVEVRPDPQSPPDAQALAANLAFALELRAALDRAADVIELLEAVEAQAADLRKRTDGHPAVRAAADAVLARVAAIDGRTHNPEAEVVYDVLAGRAGGAKLYSQIAPLYSWVHDSDDAPTAGMRERAGELLAELASIEADAAALRGNELAALEAALAAADLPHVILPAPATKTP